MEYPKVSVIIASSRSNPIYRDSLNKQVYTNLEIIEMVGYSAARARNLGVEKSTGELIVFIDDDVVLPDGWLAQGVKLLQDRNADIVGGPNIIFNQAGVLEKMSDYFISHGIFNGARRKFKRVRWEGFSCYKDFATCNLLMRKDAFSKAGPFKEKYKYTEDMEFLFRCQRSNLKMYYSPDLYVFHKRRAFPFPHARQMFGWGFGNVQLAFDYPFVFTRVDIWGSLLFYVVLLFAIIFMWKITLILILIFLPVFIHFASYASGVLFCILKKIVNRND